MKGILRRRSYEGETVDVARRLLGTILAHATPEGIASGRIVETEAYLFQADPASHAYKGKTARNAAMFGPAGRAYIYFIYGMHYCFNVVTGAEGVGEAVLIRALEPLDGIPLMERRRGIHNLRKLCNGPAKLVDALGITRAQNGVSLLRGPLTIRAGSSDAHDIVVSHRVGVGAAHTLPLRFCIKGSKFLSAAENRVNRVLGS